MQQRKQLGGLLECEIFLVSSTLYARTSTGYVKEILRDIVGFDVTYTASDSVIRVFAITHENVLVVMDCSMAPRAITTTQITTRPNSKSVSAVFTSVGLFYCVLSTSNELFFVKDAQQTRLTWSATRLPDYDLVVSADGKNVRVLYSKTSSPEQVYVDNYGYDGGVEPETSTTYKCAFILYDFQLGLGLVSTPVI
jgi:hypothetical protein